MLFQDAGEVGFGYVVGEGAVAEDDGGFPGGGQGFVPVHHAQSERLHFFPGDGRGEADEQCACADAVYGLACDLTLLHRHCQVEAQFQEQLEEDVCLGAVGFEVVDGVFQRFSEIGPVRFPCADVAAGQLEDAETEVARKEGVLFFDFLPGTTESFFGYLGDIAGLAKLIAEVGDGFLLAIVWIKWFWKILFY